MLDTNALMTATFVVISNFHTIVPAPQSEIPKSGRDVRTWVIGSPRSPADVFLESNGGASYSVKNGAVWRYVTQDSFSHLQDPSRLRTVSGETVLQTNEIAMIGTRVVRGLARAGCLVSESPAHISGAGERNGRPIPIYGMTWASASTNVGFSAEVEVDARSGRITYVWLRDPCFWTEEATQTVGEKGPPVHADAVHLGSGRPPVPDEVTVRSLLTNWMAVSRKLGIPSGTSVSEAEVDWKKAYVFTNSRLSATEPITQIALRDGTRIHGLGSSVISASLPDKYFTAERLNGPADRDHRFIGTVRRRWLDLAKEFEATLREKFGFPASTLSQFEPGPSMGDYRAEPGSRTTTRIAVAWRKWPDVKPQDSIRLTIPVEAARLGFSVEFDTETGALKGFVFEDHSLVELLVAAQSASKK